MITLKQKIIIFLIIILIIQVLITLYLLYDYFIIKNKYNVINTNNKKENFYYFTPWDINSVIIKYCETPRKCQLLKYNSRGLKNYTTLASNNDTKSINKFFIKNGPEIYDNENGGVGLFFNDVDYINKQRILYVTSDNGISIVSDAIVPAWSVDIYSTFYFRKVGNNQYKIFNNSNDNKNLCYISLNSGNVTTSNDLVLGLYGSSANFIIDDPNNQIPILNSILITYVGKNGGILKYNTAGLKNYMTIGISNNTVPINQLFLKNDSNVYDNVNSGVGLYFYDIDNTKKFIYVNNGINIVSDATDFPKDQSNQINFIFYFVKVDTNKYKITNNSNDDKSRCYISFYKGDTTDNDLVLGYSKDAVIFTIYDSNNIIPVTVALISQNTTPLNTINSDRLATISENQKTIDYKLSPIVKIL